MVNALLLTLVFGQSTPALAATLPQPPVFDVPEEQDAPEPLDDKRASLIVVLAMSALATAAFLATGGGKK